MNEIAGIISRYLSANNQIETAKMNKSKSIFILAVLLFASGFAKAQEKAEWKQMIEFHRVMSQTFHPLEEGNYQPIRERSGEMLDKAIAWKVSVIPAEFSNVKGIKKNLKQLVKKSASLDKRIKASCPDEEIKTGLTELHDIFHNIIGMCSDEH